MAAKVSAEVVCREVQVWHNCGKAAGGPLMSSGCSQRYCVVPGMFLSVAGWLCGRPADLQITREDLAGKAVPA